MMKERFQKNNYKKRFALGLGATITLTAGSVYALGSHSVKSYLEESFQDHCLRKITPEEISRCKSERKKEYEIKW